MPSSIDIGIAVSILSLIWLIFFPTSWFFVSVFYQNRHSPPIRARNLVLVYYQIIFSTLFFVQQSMIIISSCYVWSEKINKLLQIIRYVTACSTQPGITLTVARFYFGYYQVRLSVHALREEWKQLINPDCVNQTWIIKYRSTFGNFRYMFCRAILPICVTEGILTILLTATFTTNSTIIIPNTFNAILVLIKFAILLGLYKTLPAYRDIFNVRYEMMAVLLTMSSLILVFVAWVIVNQTHFHLWWLRPLLLSIESWLLSMILTAFVLYSNRKYVRIECNWKCCGQSSGSSQQRTELRKRLSQSMTSKERHLSVHIANRTQTAINGAPLSNAENGLTAPLANHSPNDKEYTNTHAGTASAIGSVSDNDKTLVTGTVNSTEARMSPKSHVENVTPLKGEIVKMAVLDVETGTDLLRMRSGSWNGEGDKHIQDITKKIHSFELRKLLADKAGFHLFMEHLFTEFSPESLLAYLEMCQFHRKYCRQTAKDCKFHRRFVVSDLLPQSAIVFDNTSTIFAQISTLVQKYVQQNASYELNLSYDVRSSCLERCKSDITMHQSEEDLAIIFDPVVISLYDLMESDSFQRFVCTESFRQYFFKYSRSHKG